MDVVEGVNGMVGHGRGNGQGCESHAAFEAVLDTLPIEISRSHVYCFDEFQSTKLADGFFGEVFKVSCLYVHPTGSFTITHTQIYPSSRLFIAQPRKLW